VPEGNLVSQPSSSAQVPKPASSPPEPAAQLTALQRAAHLLSSPRDFDDVLAKVLEACLPTLGDFGFFDVRVDGGEVLRTVRAHEDEATEAFLRPTRWMPQHHPDGINLCALTSGEPALNTGIDDAWYQRAAANEQHLAGLRHLAFRSMISVPMRFGDELLGALTLFMARSGREHGIAELRLAQDVAALAAPVVAHARLLQAEREARLAAERARQRMELLTAAGSELSQSLDAQATLQTMSRLLVPAVVDSCRIDLLNAEGQAEVACIGHRDPEWSREALELARRWRAPAEREGTIDWVIASGCPARGSVRTEDLGLIADPAVQALVQRLGVHDSLIVPLVARGRTLGALAVLQAESGRRFHPEDEGVITQIAQRAALALDNARLFAEAESARLEAERANRAKDEFLAVLGHELRNPLAPIVTALSLLERRCGDAGRRERSIIGRQVHHLSRLVDDLLDVSRIAQGRVSLSVEPLDLCMLVIDAVEAVRPSLQAQDVECKLRLPGERVMVRGDRLRLSQVLTNLLSNARKFTPPGGCVATTVSVSDDAVELTVSDTGAGIAPALLPRVFDLFVQGPQALARQQGGLGLGLAIAQSLVRLHGGAIRAESEGEGRGASFTVMLPRWGGEVLVPSHDGDRHTALAAGRIDGDVLRVLVIDDNVDARETTAALLESEGHVVSTAGDGLEALQVAAAFRPQVALVDIGLPGLDGYELARRWRADPPAPGLRLIALTGYGREPDRAHALAAGFDDHLVKPVAPEALLATLRRRSAAHS
jgi:signal transduction histidine kinase/ActR/RegA family two-component response regulator